MKATGFVAFTGISSPEVSSKLLLARAMRGSQVAVRADGELDGEAWTLARAYLLVDQTSNWIQLVPATPVVLWADWPFFTRGWYSVKNGSLNMFTLIGLDTGASWASTFKPMRFTPPCLKSLIGGAQSVEWTMLWRVNLVGQLSSIGSLPILEASMPQIVSPKAEWIANIDLVLSKRVLQLLSGCSDEALRTLPYDGAVSDASFAAVAGRCRSPNLDPYAFDEPLSALRRKGGEPN